MSLSLKSTSFCGTVCFSNFLLEIQNKGLRFRLNVQDAYMVPIIFSIIRSTLENSEPLGTGFGALEFLLQSVLIKNLKQTHRVH